MLGKPINSAASTGQVSVASICNYNQTATADASLHRTGWEKKLEDIFDSSPTDI
jgi:hypothetical protein